MQTTANLGLKKPEGTDVVNVQDFNDNADLLDIAVGVKAPLVSPALTGTPTAPTAAVDTSTTQVATTAFVLGQAGSTAPTMNGITGVGTSKRYARADHVHPVDTSRVAQVDFAAHLADYATFKSTTELDISAIEKELANYKGSTSGTDANGIDTIIEYRRQDDTLYIKKTLSNPNANGQYLTDTWVEYASDGTTVVQTIVWTYGYRVTDTSPKALPNSWSWTVM